MPAARARSFAPADKGWLVRHESGTYVKFTRRVPNYLPEAPRIKRLE
jgi:hypothetical protein